MNLEQKIDKESFQNRFMERINSFKEPIPYNNNGNKMIKEAVLDAVLHDERLHHNVDKKNLARLLNHNQALKLAHMGKHIYMEVQGRMFKVTPDTPVAVFNDATVKFYWSDE